MDKPKRLFDCIEWQLQKHAKTDMLAAKINGYPLEGNQIVETPVEARGGFLGRPVFLVLAVSLILAIAAMALPHAGFFATT